ncbi:BLUF domain-containing protein [Aestuariicella hydrocarbonica]|uniref:BLUF domain-containing protein n=1 Tax=Pseudomaricurvus hydrocarbonicus TaxID=1470433 RepID=A0A9E5MPX5_9GAMM|nr:BLUF domain-containing protein [Aestuariicella hydrocarbonica]NHO68271.1 BLUF domain-containing protein [Aestuariicella hydrocarbonica]
MSEPIIRLTYASKATFKTAQQGGIESEVARILLQSRRNNPKHAIGGVLHVADGHFFQCLEGPRAEVNATYNRIAADPRHQGLQILSMEPVTERMFSNWSMKYSAAEKTSEALLKRYDMSRFNAYQFSPGMIKEFLQACVTSRDPLAEIGQPQAAQSGHNATPWWKRIWRWG